MTRKIPQGPIRNKERTKLKLIAAVGKVLQTHGYTALGVNKIAAVAGLDKKLIYRYFGDVNTLIETYIREKDYYVSVSDDIIENELKQDKSYAKDIVENLLVNQFQEIFNSKELQQITLLEISGDKIMRNMVRLREELGRHIFKYADKLYAETGLDLRAKIAIDVAGIYYLILHSQTVGTTFCELNINSAKDRERIVRTLKQTLDLYYREAIKQKKAKKR
ncbi:TetR/AcrR family transcriptional regulator [Olivibacter sp. SDN3]|uniref:TetR/AcrR family transcriptional regulator n=1 Tax=Olivibacter sp. SDN3 TaxID=2764720 RepID=UPI0016511C7B|nr:TetR/AcrR family transcriptional regulator [Olivibacter sp. SDN3]QNL50624.1 TetR/AcrR family transcriptional regulator [Olivibacter sp. SDN3]